MVGRTSASVGATPLIDQAVDRPHNDDDEGIGDFLAADEEQYPAEFKLAERLNANKEVADG